jgi:hypothetical protein
MRECSEENICTQEGGSNNMVEEGKKCSTQRDIGRYTNFNRKTSREEITPETLM